MLFVNLIFAITSKRTGHRHVEVAIATTGNDIAYCFREFIILQYLIALSNTVISNLPIRDQDYSLEVFSDDFSRHNFRTCSTFSSFVLNLGLHLFFAHLMNGAVPFIIMAHWVCMEREQLPYSLPIVGTATCRATDINHESEFLCFDVHWLDKSFIITKIIIKHLKVNLILLHCYSTPIISTQHFFVC